jgi:hypothetical protein
MPSPVRKFVLTGAVQHFKEQRIELRTPFELYVDERVWDDLINLLQTTPWKNKFFRVIAQMMNDRHGNEDLYGREPQGLYAMKIYANDINSRLLCIEQSNGKIVILAHIEENKTRQRAQSRRMDEMYKSIAKRTYEP